MIIYLVRNTINNKCYIGLTTRTLTYRRNVHKQTWKLKRSPNSKLYKAFSKYGWDTFVWTEIDSSETLEELKIKEKYWILFFDSKRGGYNSTDGGDFNPNQGRVGKDNPKSKKFIVTNPNGEEELVHGLSEWCRKHDVLKQGLISVAKGRYKQHKGYKARYTE